jgi:hypothetical protein
MVAVKTNIFLSEMNEHGVCLTSEEVTAEEDDVTLVKSCSKPSNTKTLQSFQSETLLMISGAPWYVSNQTLHEDLKIPLIQDMIKSNINKYKNRTSMNENQLMKDPFTQTIEKGRLKRMWPEYLLDEV